jgi:hypothetical protein
MQVNTAFVYDCSRATFINQFFDSDGRRKREIEGCRTVSFAVLEKRQDAQGIYQLAEAVGRVEAPAVIQKIVGRTTTVREESRWQTGSDQITLSYRQQKLGERVRVDGCLFLEKLAAQKTRVRAKIEVAVAVFGVGRLLERFVAADIEKHLRLDNAYFNEKLAGGEKAEVEETAEAK